jgi:hypothetical protein
VVAYDGEQTSFSRLQQRLGVTNPSADHVAAYPVVFCVFDLLEVGGEDLTHRSLIDRRARLARSIRSSAALQLSEAWRGDSQRRFADACRSGWEGLIAKRADAPYARGRSKDWLKLKCVSEQDFVIGGYTDPTGSRTDFGALLVGYYDEAELKYAGKVGTGYTAAMLRRLGARLRELDSPESPFVDARPIPRGVHWTCPELVLRSASPSGRVMVGCGRRAFLGCATTSPPRRSSESGPGENTSPPVRSRPSGVDGWGQPKGAAPTPQTLTASALACNKVINGRISVLRASTEAVCPFPFHQQGRQRLIHPTPPKRASSRVVLLLR